MKVMHWDTFVFLPGECYMILFISRYKYIYLWHDTCFFYIHFGNCGMCYVFQRENLAFPCKCSNLDLIYIAWVRRKLFKEYHIDGTGSSA